MRILRTSLLLAALALLALPVRADSDHDRARRAVEAGDIRPLSEVLARIQRDHPGEVLDVELEDENESGLRRMIYEVKVLGSDGAVSKIYVDAKSLDILKVKSKGTERRRK
jgi:uncharacterized membrane protein YkoI